MKKISVIICTYNRCQLLKLCLESLVNQSIASTIYEVIVVDNNSTDDTKLIVEQFNIKFSSIIYIFESRQGLSFARNIGFKSANSEWVLYLDDDAIAYSDMLERALYTLTNTHFRCFGGIVVSYFNKTPPRWWRKDVFESNEYLLNKYSNISEMYDELPFGGIVVFNTRLLTKIEGFKTELGMNGNKLGYGEESDLIYRIKLSGERIGINTNMRIKHLVRDDKLSMKWMLKSAYAKGCNSIYMENVMLSQTVRFPNLKYFALTPLRYFKILGYSVKSLLINKEFYIENCFLIIINNLAYDVGRFNAVIKRK